MLIDLPSFVWGGVVALVVVGGRSLWWLWFGASPRELADRRLAKSRKKYEAKWERAE